MIDKAYLYLTNDGTPVLGGIFSDEETAVTAVRNYITLAKEKQSLPDDYLDEEISLEFIMQPDRRFKLIINFGEQIGHIEELANVDELMLRKFKKNLVRKSFFILTSFFEEEDEVISLLNHRRLGLIIYKI